MTASVRIVVYSLISLLCALPAQGQSWRTETPSAIDRAYMERQRETVDALARENLGRQLRNDTEHDLAVLQELLDRELVSAGDTETLQAMGIVLGDLLHDDHGLLWVIYEDRLGRSRALQVPGTEEFLFPVTMISRRVEAGIDVQVADIYRNAEEIIAEIRRQAQFR